MASEVRSEVTKIDSIVAQFRADGTARLWLFQAPITQLSQRSKRTAENPEQLRSRLSIEEAKAAHEIWRDRMILLCCLFAIPVLIIVCLLVLVVPGGPVEARTWAASTLTGIVTGIVG